MQSRIRIIIGCIKRNNISKSAFFIFSSYWEALVFPVVFMQLASYPLTKTDDWVHHLQKYDSSDQSEGAYRVNPVTSPSTVLPSSRLDLLLKSVKELITIYTNISQFERNNMMRTIKLSERRIIIILPEITQACQRVVPLAVF